MLSRCSFVVSVDDDYCRPEIPPELFGGPDDAASLEIKNGPVTFCRKVGSVHVDDRANRDVQLLLIQKGSKSVGAGIRTKRGLMLSFKKHPNPEKTKIII